jgi:acetyl-CoA carboxylase biotin carboxyl carrier protein
MDPHLTNEDVADILALLDSLPYDAFDLETPRFRLSLRRTPGGWTQSTQVLSAPELIATATMSHRAGDNRIDVTSLRSDPAVGKDSNPTGVTEETSGADELAAGDGGGHGDGGGDGDGGGHGDGGEEADGVGEVDEGGGELVAVRAPLPGTFYRAPRPGAAPFVEVGSQVGADTVIGIVETMKLMNSVPAGVAGVVAEFCVANAEFAAQGAELLRIRADR